MLQNTLFIFVLTVGFSFGLAAQNITADQHLAQGMEYYHFNKRDSALYHLTKADSLFQVQENWPESLEAKAGLVRTQLAVFMYAEGKQTILEGIAMAKEKQIWANPNTGILYSFLGVVEFLFTRDKDIAIAQTDTSMLIFQQSNTLKTHEWQAHFHRAFIYFYTGEFEVAIAKAEKSLTTATQSPMFDKAITNVVHNLLGILHRQIRQYPKSIYHYRQALEVIDKLERSQTKYRLASSKSTSYLNLGNTYNEVGQYEKAEAFLKAALVNFQNETDTMDYKVGIAYNSLGNAQFHQEKYLEAIKMYKKAENIAKTNANWVDLLGTILHNLGMSYDGMEQYDKARSYLRAALDVRKNAPYSNRALIYETMREIGGAYMAEEKWDRAIEELTKTLELSSQPDESGSTFGAEEVYLYLGHTYSQKGDYHQALEAYQQSLNTISPSPVAIADIEKIPTPSKTLQKPIYIKALNNKGNTFYRLYLKTQTEQYLHLAYQHFIELDEWISLRRHHQEYIEDQITLNEEAYEFYQNAIEVAHQLYQLNQNAEYLEKALYFSEQSKTQALQQSLSDGYLLSMPGISEAFRQQERTLRDSIAIIKEKLLQPTAQDADVSEQGLEPQLLALTQAYQGLIDSIRTRFPMYYELRHNDQKLTSSGIQQQLLKPGQQLLEYFISQTHIHVFVISQQGKDWYSVEIPEDFSTTIDDYLSAIQDNHILRFAGQQVSAIQEAEADQKIADLGHRLYQWLLGSWQDRPLAEQLIIIPDGPLGNLPFEALLSRLPSKIGAYNDYPFLLHQHQISYSYSASLLIQLQKKYPQQAVQQRLLAFAPNFSDCDDIEGRPSDLRAIRRNYLGPIQNQVEVQRLQAIVGGKALTGEEATLDNFLQESPQYAFLHIASHAKANDENPARSLISMAAEENVACRFDSLSANRVAHLSLPAEMVVLSACEGAAGQLRDGEGIRSLAMAFSYAGARSLCTSLWSVQDKAMQDLMVTYYQELKDGASKDRALRQSKLNYLLNHDSERSHPFYWAAPILIGDAKAIAFSEGSRAWPWYLLGAFIFLFFLWFIRRLRSAA
ncbi:MAG: CHAT domain-containing protein [Bacteroidota bacterium]